MKVKVFSALIIMLVALFACKPIGNLNYFALQVEATGNDDFYKAGFQRILQTPDKGIIAAGRINNDLWVMKFESDGRVAWQNTYVNAFYLWKELFIQSDGSFVIAGMSQRTGEPFLLTLETDGSVRTLTRYPDLRFHGAAQASNGFYIMGDKVGGVVLIKVDLDGKVEKAHLYAGIDYFDRLEQLIELPSGELVIAGKRGSVYSDDGQGQEDLVILKTTTDGDLIDSVIYGQAFTAHQPAGLYLNDQQQVVLGGYTKHGSFMNPEHFFHPFKLTLNQDLSIASAKRYRFNKHASISEIIPTADGGSLLSGMFGQSDWDWHQSHSALLKLDSNGEIEWAKRYEFPRSNGSGATHLVESDRGYLFTGSYYYNRDYGFIVSTTYDGLVEDTNMDIVNLTNGITSELVLESYDSETPTAQAYEQPSFVDESPVVPSQSKLTLH